MKRTISETGEKAVKHQQVSNDGDDKKQFLLKKNGNYGLTISKNKNMVLSLFKGNVYSHIWETKNKKHVSLNQDELACILSQKTDIEEIMDMMLKTGQ